MHLLYNKIVTAGMLYLTLRSWQLVYLMCLRCLILVLAVFVLLVFEPGDLMAEMDRRKNAKYSRVD
jgi:hypothetical protein